jgi:hypothetical protein
MPALPASNKRRDVTTKAIFSWGAPLGSFERRTWIAGRDLPWFGECGAE